jgi:hypothetical protein
MNNLAEKPKYTIDSGAKKNRHTTRKNQGFENERNNRCKQSKNAKKIK